MNKHNLRKNLNKVTVVMYAILALFLLMTDPRNMPVYFLIIPIAWLFICITLTIFLALSRVRGVKDGQNNRNMVYALSASAMFCAVILLRSVNQLNGRDMILVVVFLVIASFYARKFKLSP